MEQGPPQGPQNKSNEQKPRILTFEEFSVPIDEDHGPAYNNFFFKFASGIYKNKKYYKMFRRQYPDMYKSFSDKVIKTYPCSMKHLLREGYEVYKIMRSNGVSDEDLFS